MLRFGKLLIGNSDQLVDLKISEIFPQPVFTRIIFKGKHFKWAAYLDKYLLFPRQLARKISTHSNSIDLVHIVDHSNSVYLNNIKRACTAKLLVTCHDLIAIRTALGEFPSAPSASPTGKRLQSWIRSSLDYADYYSCDSNQTKEDLNRLIPKSSALSKVIHLGTESQSLSSGSSLLHGSKLLFEPGNTDFILHVGSAAWYKNRKAVFQSFINAREKNLLPDLKLVLVGPEPQGHETAPATYNWFGQHQDSIISLHSLEEAFLKQLYLHAKALVFPSHVEGFGWPPLEAALSGCPVITTRSGAIYDLLGDYPRYVQSMDQDSINRAVDDCLQTGSRKPFRLSLPDNATCRNTYHELYQNMLDSSN